MSVRLCYLDAAATSFPKPRGVIREVSRCMRLYGGNASRGSHRLSLAASRKLYECRELAAELINAPTSDGIIFVPSCTYGINLILKGLLRSGDHVLISDMEHNCTLRPLHRLSLESGIRYEVFNALSTPSLSDDEIVAGIERRIKRNTRLIVCNHVSNVCSYSLPIEKIGELCKKFNIPLVVDVAQSIGIHNIDMQKMNISFLSAPGHKGLLGVQGSAFIAINSPQSDLPSTLIEGGNGVFSLSPEMPDTLPERYEVGTLPLPAISGLCEGIREVRRIGISAIREQEEELFLRTRDGLLDMGGVSVYLPDRIGSTLLFNIDGVPTERVCALLDSEGICVRGGFHCSALAHASLGTENVGAVRASFGIYNTESDVARLLSAVKKIKKSAIWT